MADPQNQFSLLNDRRFLPLFLTQFLGALHDNVYKNALAAFIVYGAMQSAVDDPKLWASLATAIFILPFILFSAFGGQLADKYPKDAIIRIIKIVEIGIAILAFTALLSQSLFLCFATLFMLGAQSAFFGPSKFSILPQNLDVRELIGGNALVNTGTFLAILCGTLIGVVFINTDNGTFVVGTIILLIAIFGYISARFIPPAPSQAPDLKLDLNPIRETIAVLHQAYTQEKDIVIAILGVAWFYFIGAIYLGQMVNFTQSALHVNEHVLALFLMVFSIGIAIGGLLNNRFLKGEISARLTPIAAFGIAVFSIDLFLATQSYALPIGDAHTVKEFFASLVSFRVTFDLMMIAICGGLFVVPLNAIIQHKSAQAERARIIAGGAITNAAFIIVASLLASGLIIVGWSIPAIYVTFGSLNLAVAAIAWHWQKT